MLDIEYSVITSDAIKSSDCHVLTHINFASQGLSIPPLSCCHTTHSPLFSSQFSFVKLITTLDSEAA